MESEFDRKVSKLVRTDELDGGLGLQRISMHHTIGGVTSLVSHVLWLEDISEQELEAIPDSVLSDTLLKDLDISVSVCAMNLKKTKYLPKKTEIGSRYGAVPEDDREGVFLANWEDFGIPDHEGNPLYTSEILQAVPDGFPDSLAFALSRIAEDICNDGGFISADWYSARILFEYFREYPIPPDNAYLVGELFKELCLKEQFEGDLASYYARLTDEKIRRQKGADATQKKASELRQICMQAFIELADEKGHLFLMAPHETQATELREKVIAERPQEFQRGGKPYRIEWFLRNVVEDMRIEIIDEMSRRKKGSSL